MIPFLHNVAQAFYKAYGNEISTYTFVFPNRRVGIFFQKYLAEIAKHPIFSPEILTVADLFGKLSSYKVVDRIEMLFILYENYQKTSKSTETFDEFLFWGDMLLGDFDDVDKYMVDAQQLFRNIYDLKEIDAGFSYLTEEQVEAIRRFWVNFLPVGNSNNKKEFLEIWEVLFDLYTHLRESLKEKGLAYEGMVFREVAEKAKSKQLETPFTKIIFVGLNGHSKSEEDLLKYLQQIGIADFYWDYSSSLVKDPSNKSSFFIDKNRLYFPSQLKLEPEELSMDKPTIEVIGVPSLVGQAKYVNTILQELNKNEEIRDNALNTALVLPEENLLLPSLYSMPEDIEKINVTMGYNLSNSAIAGLMDHVFEVQRNIRYSHGEVGFYFRFVLSILNHRYVSGIAEKEVEQLRKNIVQYNKVIVPYEELCVHPFLKLIFTPISDWNDISAYLREVLAKLEASLSLLRNDDDDSARTVDMECEFIIEYYKTINKMEEALKHVNVEMSVETYYRLLKKLILGVSVPFTGEPLSGLQVMGVLETRALDFENLIILSMNEGIFPMKKAANSFIPYNLRKGFGLPTYEHQDSIFAYHFYRMINRAKRIYLLYDTRTEGMQTGEPSRYIHQIKHLYADLFDISERLAVYEVSSSESLSISVTKSPEVLTKLDQFCAEGERSLSASSINMYIDCPLQFYFSVVEKMQEEDEISETVEADTFGSIFHSVMEWLYRPLEGKMVTADLLHQIRKDDANLTKTIERSFAENYFKIEKAKKLTGQNFLTGEVIRRYAKQVLKTDAKHTPFIYIQSEKRLKMDYTLPSGRVVSLKGFIDRIDESFGRTRIIDYKTGRGVLQFKTMDQVFDKTIKDRPKAVMQVFMYAYLYQFEFQEKILEPGIYYLRNLFSDKFDADVIHKPSRDESLRVADFAVYRDEFKDKFDSCLEEIFDESIPFTQTPTGKPCEWCSFKNICRK